jgi:Fic family protein
MYAYKSTSFCILRTFRLSRYILKTYFYMKDYSPYNLKNLKTVINDYPSKYNHLKYSFYHNIHIQKLLTFFFFVKKNYKNNY